MNNRVQNRPPNMPGKNGGMIPGLSPEHFPHRVARATCLPARKPQEGAAPGGGTYEATILLRRRSR